MQTQSKSWPLVLAILIAALMVCATLLALNLHTTYRLQGMGSPTYLHLLYSGCTPLVIPGPPDSVVAVTCPLWINP
jgi:hypothetical protein